MIKLKFIHLLMPIIFLSACNYSIKEDNPIADKQIEYQLWYQQPANNWNEALPVGNGRLGAMVFGDVYSERIQLNEESLWAGKRFNGTTPMP
jgi:alpha-L-fucosidase 2